MFQCPSPTPYSPVFVYSALIQPSPCTGSTIQRGSKKFSLIWSPLRSFGLSQRILSTAGRRASRPAMGTRHMSCWSHWVSVEVLKFTQTLPTTMYHYVNKTYLVLSRAFFHCTCYCASQILKDTMVKIVICHIDSKINTSFPKDSAYEDFFFLSIWQWSLQQPFLYRITWHYRKDNFRSFLFLEWQQSSSCFVL